MPPNNKWEKVRQHKQKNFHSKQTLREITKKNKATKIGTSKTRERQLVLNATTNQQKDLYHD